MDATVLAPSALSLSGSALVECIDRRLNELLPAVPAATDPLRPAMRHALLGPGKRVRVVLAVLAGRELGGPDGAALDAGCAVEMLHAASLVFDDLPAMDDAAERRGRPATHRVHGEATAMLAGIALIARAFTVVAGMPQVPPSARAAMAGVLSRAIGSDGLAGGQLLDIHAAAPALGMDALDRIGARKTGALFVAAVDLSACAAGAGDHERTRLRAYAAHLGRAFQICDDLLDADEDAGRGSYVGVLGRTGARRALRAQVMAARSQLGSARGPLARLLDGLFADHLEREDAVP